MRMSSFADSSSKGSHVSQADVLPTGADLDEWRKSPAKGEEDEDEDEDVDFNPFLKETPSPDASSSLSSEIEGIDGDVVENGVKPLQTAETYLSELTDEGQSFAVEDSEHCEGGNFVLNSPKLVCEQELPELVAGTLSKTDSEILSQAENGHLQGKEDHTSSRPDSHSDVVVEATNSWKAVMHSDEEDAICKRTRARYSLARFTLDELESFLQETDDDEDIQNVDDEEEYKKFLAAVLIGGDGNGHPTPDTGNVDDEDEDNDADFEIELEEALESDLDDRPSDKITKGNFEPSRRRPETRQNRRKDTSAECKKKLLQHGKRPLRPLLPLVPVGSTPYLPASSGQPSMTDAPLNYASLTANVGCMNGFAPNQIGQLYCLIHEHVQLLIQIYSLCILDPSRQNIASQVEELILQMLHKRDQIVARRSIPYPGICFSPAYVCSSTSEGSKASNMAQQTLGCASTLDAEGVTSSVDNQMLATLNGSQGQGQGEYAGSLAVFSRAMEGSVWLPHISGPVLSVLDVAPLNLVKKYIDDLRIVREQRRWHVESTCDIRSEREPLFPTSSSLSAVEGDIQVLSGVSSSNARGGSPSSGHHPLKRSLAAAIVESAKKQSVALVQKDVAKLAQIFFPLFNQALLPHKPPPSAVANRVLFTDAEDELLALGIMEFNTDWKAIQQRFLPCKSKHQIFVRQKNRCSSKAPENPIKAVRRMKTSPLTAEEVQYIQEGFKIYKLDWMSVCKFIVPHRDPSLLPRQWRVALGTQKSYKQNPTKKEKRRAYEAERRRRRGANPASWQNASEKEDYQVEHAGGENSCEDDCIDDPEEPYVHEGFLVDWRPSFKQPHPYVGKGGIHGISEEAAYETQHHAGSMHQFPIASTFQNTYSASRVIHNNVHGTSVPVHPVSETSLWTAKSPFGPLSHRGRQTDSARLVKLAPNLPPVNLPQNVRVISQSAYLSCDGAASAITGTADNRPCHAAKVGDTPAAQQSKSMSLNDSVAQLPREESRAFKEKTVNEERGIDSDSQMHPLLFQVPEDGGLPYYPSNCNTLAPAPLSFFSGSQPQLNLSLFHNPQQLNNDRSFRPRDSASNVRGSGIDFHPLLQGTEEVNGDLTSASSKAHQSVSVAVKAKVPASGVSLTTGTDLSCCADRVSELDLDIHLSSSSSLGKTIGKNTGATHKLMTPIRHSAKSGTLLNSQQASNPFDQQPENLSSVRTDLISGSQMLSRQNDVVQSNMDLAGDESHPGIIMEQEELSDSDEDIEEHVEFECEEMADSEGEEESSMEIVADTNNKEVQNHAAEKVSMELHEDHGHESRNGHCLKSNDSTPGNSSLPSLKLGLTCEGRDTASKSWLSLDPRLRGCPPNPAGETQAQKLRSPRPNRSCKKTKTCTRNNMEQVPDQTMEAAKRVDLGTSTVPNRRPRKRTCRSNANSEVGIAMKSG